MAFFNFIKKHIPGFIVGLVSALLVLLLFGGVGNFFSSFVPFYESKEEKAVKYDVLNESPSPFWMEWLGIQKPSIQEELNSYKIKEGIQNGLEEKQQEIKSLQTELNQCSAELIKERENKKSE